MNVLVIFGGASFEHDVSIITGSVVYNKLKDKYNLFPLYIDKEQNLKYFKNLDINNFDKNKGKKVSFIKRGFRSTFTDYKVDVAIICNHGLNGEDGMVKALLDFYDIPSIGSNLISSAVNMDKYFSYCILKENNINVVKSTFITENNFNHDIEYPIILKPARLGSSIGISVCHNEDEFYDNVINSFKYDKKIVVQEYFKDITELNISLYKSKKGIITSKIEIVDKHSGIYSYEDKYGKCDFKKHQFLKDDILIKKIEDMAIKSYEILELSGIVRIDFMLVNDEVYLNEVNSIPGSLSYYLYDKQFYLIIKELISKELFDQMHKKCYIFNSDILHYEYNMKK